jgi:hypothetical protein
LKGGFFLRRIERDVFVERNFSTETGEIVSSKTVSRVKDEPDYVKLYLDCLLTVKGLRKGLNPILVSLLKHMSYANSEDATGGQIIIVNKFLKETIANNLGLGIDSINKALGSFADSGIFKRIAVGTYQVNPDFVGKGEWKDIRNIKATFDFANKSVVAEIVKYEEEEMTDNQTKLDEEFKAVCQKEGVSCETI